MAGIMAVKTCVISDRSRCVTFYVIHKPASVLYSNGEVKNQSQRKGLLFPLEPCKVAGSLKFQP